MADAGQGPGWQIPGRPTMKSSEWSGADISFLDTTGNVQYMKSGSTPGTYDALFGNRNTLSRDTSTNVLTLRSSDGTATVFNAITSSTNPGQMQSSTSPGGSSTTLTGTFGANQIMEMLQSYTSGGTTYEESFLQTYDANALLQTLVRRKRTNGGTWENIERVTYTYYDGTTSFGSPRDLKRCVEETWVGGSVNNFTAPKNTYFRYYKWSMNPQPGFEHGMKYMVSPATWQKIVSDGKNPETIPDHELDQYADRYFEYEPTTRRVSLWRTNGGTRQMMLNYSGNLNGVPSPAPFNHWAVKSTLDRTDGLRQIFYSNSYGMVMLSVLQGANGLQKWCSFTRFDDAGRAIWQISPSAITGYDETKNDLLNYNSGTQTYQYVRDTSGLIQTMEYDTNTATENYVKYANLRKGQLGSDIRQSLTEYTTNTVGGTTRILLSRQTVYTDDSHAVPIETIYGYLFHSGTLQPSQITTTLPAVPTTQNGSGTSATTFQEFDILGNMTASIDERGLETGYTHDPFTGAVTQSVLDVGGQNLTSDFEIDSLGRTTQTLGPVHEAVIGTTPTNVRIASWTTYDDSTNTVTSASGYAVGTSPSYTYTLVNPVSITISNDGGNVLEQIQATRASTSGKLLPTDTFSQSSYVRWTTNQYEQCCRISSTRSYFLIPSTGVGTEGTNYNTTSFGYDQMLRRNQTTSPGGTINFTVFDDRNLVKAVYVGTNATGATENDPTGGGAAGNNMVIVTQNDYDNGQAGGDGNLTTTLAWVSSSVYRRTSMTYDFRNRQTSVTGEENAYSETTYDNLNRPTLRQTRDGSSSAVLLSKAQTDYDDRGRVYRTTTWAVNPSTGAIGNALVGDTWYDAGSNVIKSLPAGAELFSKTTFDILGRATAQYVGYNLSAPTYAEAQTVVNDTIMEQQTMTYNQIGTALSTVSKQRYHDAAASQLGALGDPSTSPKARVTYSASWIDGVGRIIASADYGTNGGSSFTRPSAIPTRSDTILVSSTTFNDDGEVFSTFDPKNTETRIEYDDAGRQTIQIENYVSGGTNADQNRTTWTTYAPDGPVKTLTASNSDTGNQQTIYFYGTTLSDSDIASSQLLRYVRYPDSDGTNGDYVSYSYNRQGQQTLVVDQRGCQHAYDYDGLGRQIHDRALSLGTSAVGASRRLSTVYNTRGMVDTVTTWDNPLVGFGTVLNQVQNVYNDFGQQTHSYQAHDGSVNTSTTPKVQYSYANGSANTIRMTGMTYPSGRGLTYSYGTGSGINDACSRIESVINTSDSVNLGTYQYLGSSGFVNAASGQPGINWTLIGTGNDPDTGDKQRKLPSEKRGKTVEAIA
jgi:YD repeat-containing protein